MSASRRYRTSFSVIRPPLHLLRDGELVGRWTSPASYPSTSPRFAGKGSGGSAGTIAWQDEARRRGAPSAPLLAAAIGAQSNQSGQSK
jgi:hypothetical protein